MSRWDTHKDDEYFGKMMKSFYEGTGLDDWKKERMWSQITQPQEKKIPNTIYTVCSNVFAILYM